MYFQIENTPEHVRRVRRLENAPKELPKEECPQLILAPFSRPPQVIFDNVLMGGSCKRNLEVINPLKEIQQITLDKDLPPGLMIDLPGTCIQLEPETCYILTMTWTPTQPTAMRETIRFTNETRGRYDVIIVLKTVMNIKGKKQAKGFKTSPGKIKKKVATKKSPVSIYKKKTEVIYNTTAKLKKTFNVIQSTQHKVYQTFNKENISGNYSNDSYPDRCPFDSPSSLDLNFNTSEVFSNMKKTNMLHETYDKSHNFTNQLDVPNNVLRPLNKQSGNVTVTDIFENLTFTPLKSVAAKTDTLVKSEIDFVDNLDMKVSSNKENQTHSIISVTSSQPPYNWLTENQTHIENQYAETPTVLNKKHPNTSSPKELNSPNFSINTEFSRISELSFFPQRFSTERKCFPKVNETHELLDDKLSSDTYTKDSPNTLLENYNYQAHLEKPPHYFNRDQPKFCRQSLFREYHPKRDGFDGAYFNSFDNNVWQNELRLDTRSPPRSITPPLQSIPEESVQFVDSQLGDKTNKQMATFTIDRTFDRTHDQHSTSTRQTWSKKAIRVEPDLWKIPVDYVKKSKVVTKPKDMVENRKSNINNNKSINQNVSVNQIGNIYSQSSTVDPFLSATYFYDEEAVHKFENEFKRWLNCILTPPADLESNEEQKIDVGKAWIENRNKEVPLAPTKEQVSSAYHNSHRLESLRRSARNLLKTPDIAQVFEKLNAQIEKKLIAIRVDRNLHLDVGLQKIIMEVLLSYNPLWLRIGLESIYGLVLPLKSNSDIEGLTTFIIQRMFKNPNLKNKHSKASAPNMLLPAYMEAIKKYTLKKFFMLVFFLDQAKQKKLISHDPCLFCRNAICKESREIIIRFTRELIAGIGDITKHLRPLGYIVCHKQSYLDEYKYAVHNLALDIRDGVRLTKVMEIIMMKNGLLNQLRTPAISRLQKKHNVQVALKALKDSNFVIVGDITATDIADGHREKTLSLLWQIIHVFRAPLFEKAANVIQTWWKKKYQVIVEKRREEERIRNRLINAASVIQHWWRKIQYSRQVEWQMQQITRATIVLQKYCRMWLCRSRLRRFKTSVLKIEEWFKSAQLVKEAIHTLTQLRVKREQLRHKSAITIQSQVRRWLCVKRYNVTVQSIVKVQSLVRRFLIKKRYVQLKKSVTFIQHIYRGRLLMRLEMQKLAQQRRSAILIQSYYRMTKKRKAFLNLKKSVMTLEDCYIAIMKMRKERGDYLKLTKAVIAIQALWRQKQCRDEYQKQRRSIILLQRRFRAHQVMKKDKANFLKMKNAAITLQTYFRSYIYMKNVRKTYMAQRKSAILIQKYFRSFLLAKSQREYYIHLRKATLVLQKYFKSLLLMKRERKAYIELRNATIRVQRQYRAQVTMRKCKENYTKLKTATLTIQHRYRALIKMREQRTLYLILKKSCTKIQHAYRAYVVGNRERQNYLKQKEATLKIQKWYRNCKKGKEIKQQYQQIQKSCVTIQRYYKAHIIGKEMRKEYLLKKAATICIQRFYRAYIETKTIRQEYIKIKTSTVKIQRFYRSYLETKKMRTTYLTMKSAVLLIENIYKRHKQYKTVRQRYLQLREATITVQRRYRSLMAMRLQRNQFLRLKQSAVTFQMKYRALISMRVERRSYLELRSAVVSVQSIYRAKYLMKQERLKYATIKKACVSIQRFYRAYVLGTKTRQAYLKLKNSVIIVQRRYRALLAMRKERSLYIARRTAAITIQRRLRANNMMLKDQQEFTKTLKACQTIQRAFRAYLEGKKQRTQYLKIKSSVILIQTRFRMMLEMKKIRLQYLQLRKTTILVQRKFRANQLALTLRRNEAASKIQTWYRSLKKRDTCRNEFLLFKKQVITVQSMVRMHVIRKEFFELKTATVTIQKYYRSYKQTVSERSRYIHVRKLIITVQSYIRRYIARKRYLRICAAVSAIQDAYRRKRQRDLLRIQRELAAIVIQKHIRRYLAQSWYKRYRQKVIYLQQIWRGKLITRLIHCDYLQKRRIVVKIQSAARGYLVRRRTQLEKEQIAKIREEQKQNWAASKIQALFRGHKTRLSTHDVRVVEIRRRWRKGALQSKQESLKERNEEAMEVLRNTCDIETIIRAFKSLDLLTEVFPMMYKHNAALIVQRVCVYMSVTNRSISSIEVLKSGAAILVNLARYKATGPKIYSRDRIPPILKFMWRFSNSETLLFCILSTYLWLCSKYDEVKQDLTELLHVPENHKILVTIKGNIDRMKRMCNNTRSKFHTPQSHKYSCHTNRSMNSSVCSTNSNTSFVMPSLEPDYGIARMNRPRYFEDAQQAIDCLFNTYNL